MGNFMWSHFKFYGQKMKWLGKEKKSLMAESENESVQVLKNLVLF